MSSWELSDGFGIRRRSRKTVSLSKKSPALLPAGSDRLNARHEVWGNFVIRKQCLSKHPRISCLMK